MSDDADRADELSAPLFNAEVAQISARAKEMPAGTPGDCGECGEHSARLVDGLCARCRDLLAGWQRRVGNG